MTTTSIHRKEDNTSSIYFYDYHPEPVDFHKEVINGMASSPRVLAPKFFYDEKGSQLFDAICETLEYYPTRTELSILEQNIDEIAEYIGEDCLLIEPGSGSSQKVRLILDTINPIAYMPMDISKDYLRLAAEDVASGYPWLEVHAACVDYTRDFSLPPCHQHARKVAFFPGSSIGNFEPEQAITFLRHLSRILQAGGGLLIGVDLKKDIDTLNAAYNDNAGMTAAFNQNLLTRISNELNADFDVEKFHHHAFYNKKLGRIEMHLVSNEEHTVSIDQHRFKFKKNESIHTESSYKYTVDEFQMLAEKAGFKSIKAWTDADDLFSVHYFEMDH